MDRANVDRMKGPRETLRASGAPPLPVVLVHGFAGSGRSWGDDLRRALVPPAVRVVDVDLPGHGGNTSDRGGAPCTLEGALESISRAVSGPFDLVGYSMGGRVALHAALCYPDRIRRLVLESASPGLATERERADRRGADEALAGRIEGGGVAAFVDEWSDLPVLRAATQRPDEVETRIREIRLANHPADLGAALRGLGTGAIPSLWDRLDEVRAPVLILAGAADPKFVDIARRMAAAIPDAEVEIVPGAGHTVHLDRPDSWSAAVRQHLAAH
ncbi:MAG: 2-succinyl-6-hydroxy-2,4-cyclohexadiene-1-carboxylate synthase [Thioalkalivibrio sp.]|nr:2-succinyl-6-hydroxy-2,4-cyclohexadiene-1-carboxylate synthase [Thioalkalivibrio sp.]